MKEVFHAYTSLVYNEQLYIFWFFAVQHTQKKLRQGHPKLCYTPSKTRAGPSPVVQYTYREGEGASKERGSNGSRCWRFKRSQEDFLSWLLGIRMSLTFH